MDRLTYTVTETAALLGISRTSAYECVRRGEIPSLTLGPACGVSRRVHGGERSHTDITAHVPTAPSTPP